MRTFEREYELECSAPVLSAMNDQYAAHCGPAGVWTYTLAAEEQPGNGWYPFVRRIVEEGVGELEVPAEFQRGGAVALACVGPTPDIAHWNLYLRCA